MQYNKTVGRLNGMASQDFFEVPQLAGSLNCTVTVPGSKSITNRALLIAALADAPVELENVLFSDDSRNFIGSLKALGFELEVDEPAQKVRVVGLGGRIPERNVRIYVGSAGTAARFITAMLALSAGEYWVEASPQMSSRPMKPLLDSLKTLGARFEFLEKPDCLPFKIYGTGSRANRVLLQANVSSQFLSALLLAGCYGPEDLEVSIDGEVAAKPFVEMTLTMMEQFGVTAYNHAFRSFVIPAGQKYQGNKRYLIEPDISNANYFYAMALLTGGTVTVKGVKPDSLQGDIRFLELLRQMGAIIEENAEGILVKGPKDGVYPGIDADLGALPDQTMTLAALAPFATSPTIIRNVGLIKYHESNRLRAISTELTRMGVKCVETDDGLMIHPGVPKPVEVETYEDHRMAMAFALIGLKTPGTKINNPGCTAKTFEGYFDQLTEVATNCR
jgi:3-phosphoshikimate 1-carboxyvinyltransferase